MISIQEMPHSHEAEQAVIGSILKEPAIIEKVLERIDHESLYQPLHKKILKAMTELFETGTKIDILTVTTKLASDNLFISAGSSVYLTDLQGSIASAETINYHIGIVAEQAKRRKLIRLGEQLQKDGYSNEDIDAVLANLDNAKAEIEPSIQSQGFKHAGEVVKESYAAIEKVSMFKGQMTGIPSGYVDIDKMTAGLNKSDLIIWAARPSVGKTALALNVGQNVAIRSKEPVAIFSLEMSAPQLVTRMICAEGMIDASRIRSGLLEENDWQKLTMAIGTISKAPIYIDDTAAVTTADIRRRCKKLQQEKGLGLILIDYLQLLRGKGGNRQEEVSSISRELKSIARELDVPIIALSQLSRSVEQRQDKRPMMSDLRESGSLEQDADLVAFLYRDDYYNKDSESKNIVEFIVAKQRNGPTGTVELVFLKEYNKFSNIARQLSMDDPA
ncbi:replicative DNA helicase [Brevibacillus laterosporus]|uniref:replicative DNA helicase n=1 Tax=Brevibacillus laterosporus TaxID=1465 RepID=UPI000EAD9907|nr:replicative DNA helicase [Brevibacillus laterosporus]AYK08889.1 replicative DNA helicase [Brevibacillus laterosporus]